MSRSFVKSFLRKRWPPQKVLKLMISMIRSCFEVRDVGVSPRMRAPPRIHHVRPAVRWCARVRHVRRFSRSACDDRKSRDAHSDTFWERAEPREEGRETRPWNIYISRTECPLVGAVGASLDRHHRAAKIRVDRSDRSVFSGRTCAATRRAALVQNGLTSLCRDGRRLSVDPSPSFFAFRSLTGPCTPFPICLRSKTRERVNPLRSRPFSANATGCLNEELV